MSVNWNYAEMSKAAKAAGGPEKYVKLLEAASKKAGKLEMVPLIGLAAVSASLLTAVAMRAYDYYKSQKESANNEIVLADGEIVKGIKEYDATHTTEEGSKENADVSEL